MSGPAGKFYFAEGTVRPGFDTYLCVQNPEQKEADVRVTFMKGNGTTQVKTVKVPPLSRYTMSVGETYQGATLTQVYEKNLESFFQQCLYYQTIGAVTYANALDYQHPDDPVYSGKAWINNTYLKTYMKNESDLFWSCVEQLVMAKADANQYAWSTQTKYLKLPTEATAIFARADLLRKIAMGQIQLPDTGTTVNGGICGRVIGAQDAVPKGQAPAIKIKNSAGTQYSASFSEPGGSRTHEQEVAWLSTAKVQQYYDCWSAASGTDKTLSISGYWSTPRYQFDQATAFPDGTYTVVSPTGSTLGTATVSKTPFPDPRDNTRTLNLSFGSFAVPWRNSRLACDPAQWTTSEVTGDTCNPDPTTSFRQDLTAGVEGIWMKISSAKGDSYNKKLSFRSNSFSSPADLPLKLICGMNFGTQSSSGQQKSSLGYVYSHIDWYTDDAHAKTNYKVYLWDETANTSQNTIQEETASVTSDSGKYTKDANFGLSNSTKTISATLKAGHKYHLILELYGEISADEGGAIGGGGGDAEVNQRVTITGLGVMAP
jgi:hypothetical protein